MALNTIRAIAAYTLLEALRNRLLWLVGAFIGAAFVLAEFVGEVAITETAEVQSGFLGAALRLCTIFMISLFVITSMVRELNDKVLELVLSQPIPRASYYFGKLTGYSVVALLSAVLCGAFLCIYAPWGQVAMWSVSLALELLLIIALSLLCLFTFSHVTLALSAVVAFYVLARTVAALQLIAESPLLGSPAFSQTVLLYLVKGLAFLMPSLERFTASSWLVYHDAQWTDLTPIALQTLIYLVLLIGAGLFDLYRKNL